MMLHPRTQLLLKRNVPLDQKNKYHDFTALHCAANRGHAECVQLLRDAGADANLQDDVGNTPLHHAAYFNEVDSVKTLTSTANVDFKIKVRIEGRNRRE